MDELQSLKKNLKKWETLFYKVHGKKPQREDIQNAPDDIQETYSKYNKLKKSLQTTSNVANSKENGATNSTENGANDACNKVLSADKNSDEVWGKQFDRQENDKILITDTNSDDVWGKQFDRQMPMNTKSVKAIEKAKDTSSDFAEKLREKMFKNSLKMKSYKSNNIMKAENFRKSCSFSKNKTINLGENSEKDTDHNENEDVFKSSEESVSMNFEDSDWGSKSFQDPAFDRLNETGDISKSSSKCNSFHSSIRTFKNVSSKIKKINSDTDQRLGEVIIPKSLDMKRKLSVNLPAGKISHGDEDDDTLSKSFAADEQKYKNLVEGFEDFDEVDSLCVKDVKKVENKTSGVDTASRSNYQSGALLFEETTKKTLSNDLFQNKPSNNNSLINEETRNIFDFEPDKNEEMPKKRKKRKPEEDAGTKNKRQKIDIENDQVNLEMDVDDVEEVSVPKKKKAPAVAAPRKKTSVSAASDNFVRLNMKIKTYKRKGKAMTGPQYKRKLWKQKMKARSESYGDKCFKCGQSGHWANKCKANAGINTKSVETDPVIEEDFPTMKEAAMMARGIKPVKEKQNESDVADISKPDNEDEDLDIEAAICRTGKEETVAPPPLEPILNPSELSYTNIPDFVTQGLKKFGYEKFRPGQQKAVLRILSGLSTLVVLSTGGGKSLCYQLSAYLYAQRSKAITLVVSPLVSLMEDQISGLPPGIRGACLHTNMTSAQRENVLSAVKDNQIHFLLVSPEAIAGGSMSLLNSKSSLPPIAFVCIDEAHCLSEWSHNFRPSYLRLCKVLREKFGVQTFLGLTATATQSTASDVAKHLGIHDSDDAVIRGAPVPKNLNLSVSRDENRDEALLGMLQGERFASCESIIIYCTRREQTDRIATLIRTCLKDEKGKEILQPKEKKKGGRKVYAFWDAESYHAGHTAAQRKRIQNAFMSGRLRIVVATVAFGMGLDKSNVRGVIHYNMPKSFESYVQEIGRAGRDGKPSHCHLFLDSEGKDLCELRRHTYANTVDYRTLKKFIRKIFPACRCKDVAEKHENALKEKEGAPDNCDKAEDINEDKHSIDPATEVDQSQTNKKITSNRICPGHERALPIESTVMDLDVKEEGLSTLLCYLELHSDQWLENLTNVYATCRIQCYGGPAQLQSVAKKCPPVAVAVAKAKKEGKSFANSNSIEFPVVDISDCMGWESGPVKREIKMLQWHFNQSANTGPRKSGVMVEFSDLAFHFRSPGDLDDDDIDDVLQFLHERVQKQEKSELQQLKYLYTTLRSVSHKNYWMCSDDLDEHKNEKLKSIMTDYFHDQQLPMDDNDEEPIPKVEINQVISDIRQFINLYSHEHALNGRAIARVFHGIGSPCFPAQTWGRVRRFWRSHMDVDFNELVKIATQEIIKSK